MSQKIKVGIFLVAGILLFCVGLFLIGSRKHLFGQYFTVYVQFNDVDTLQSGAKVRVSGLDAGQVSDIEVPKTATSEFRLKLKIDKKLRAIVREDSVATIETEGMVGNKFVNVKKGSEHSPVCSACTLHSEEPVSMDAMMRKGSDLANSMQSTIDDLHHRADGAMQNITNLTGHADNLVTGVTPKFEKITSNSDAIIAGVRNGHGAAGKLLTDDTVGSNVAATIANAKQASTQVNTITSDIQRKDLPDVHQALQNTQAMTQQMNQAVGTFLAPGNHQQSTALALREAAHGAERTSTNLAEDTEAIKHNFFLRGFFKRRGFYDLETLTPGNYDTTEFVKKPRARVWIPAPGLFDTRPDGSEALSKTGQSIVDQYMSDLVRYLPNNPIMVEGYSTSGMPDQRYVTSRQRALAVQQYLESHFHLNPKRLGIMPLGDHPPAEKQVWDGICLVLVVSGK